MKIALAMLFLITGTFGASAQYYGSPRSGGLYGTGSNPNSHYVAPHYNRNSGYVGGHYRTNPNSTQMDNFGTRGNFNAYTGTYGTRRPRY
jgi:hypothetical protein